MANVVKDLLTGRDGESHDIARYSWAVTVTTAIAGFLWNMLHNSVVDLQGFGMAIATIVGAHGGAIWAKKATEPGQKE